MPASARPVFHDHGAFLSGQPSQAAEAREPGQDDHGAGLPPIAAVEPFLLGVPAPVLPVGGGDHGGPPIVRSMAQSGQALTPGDTPGTPPHQALASSASDRVAGEPAAAAYPSRPSSRRSGPPPRGLPHGQSQYRARSARPRGRPRRPHAAKPPAGRTPASHSTPGASAGTRPRSRASPAPR